MLKGYTLIFLGFIILGYALLASMYHHNIIGASLYIIGVGIDIYGLYSIDSFERQQKM